MVVLPNFSSNSFFPYLQSFSKMFKVFDFFQQAIKSCNVFTSPVNLRYKLDPDYNTFAGGIVSIILILLLMSVFFNSWRDLLNKADISSSTETIREFDPSYMALNSNDFMFAIGINGMNLNDDSEKRYFSVTASRTQVVKNSTKFMEHYPFTLEPCTLSHWEQFGEDFVQTYKRQGLGSYLCPSKNISIEIIGKWTSQNFTFLTISFDKCKGSNCRSEDEIKQWAKSKKSFYFNFFYSNTLLNPDQSKPISMFLQDKVFTMFSPSLGTFTNIYLGGYQMQTDESIFPWIESKVDKGYIVNQAEKQVVNFIPGQEDPYCQLFLRKSNEKLKIQRKFRKLDDMLSYIGGLFGIIAVAVGVVMKYYGQCSFELQMCQKIFDYHNNKQDKTTIKQHSQSANGLATNNQVNLNDNSINQKSEQKNDLNEEEVIEPKDFGFFDFFFHILVYIPLKKLFNINWKRMQIYEESLEEMRYKLDISQLMEKITFYDRSINALFDENQLKLLYLQEKFNFQEVREQRNMLSLRQGIVANLFESKQTNSNDCELSSSEEYKKSLKEIAVRNSKRIHTFLRGQNTTVNLLQVLAKEKEKKINQETDEKGDKNLNLPEYIKTALTKLDNKIEKGDVVSTRIYNGLQYELLEAYQKSKLNRNGYSVTSKNIKIKRGAKSGESQQSKIGMDNRLCKDYADYVLRPSLTSINNLRQNTFGHS